MRSLAALSVGHPRSFGAAGLEQREKSWYMLLFQFEEVAEEMLRRDDWKLMRDWTRHHPELARWIPSLERPGALRAALNWYRANAHPAASLADAGGPPFPSVRARTLGLWSSGDAYLTEAQMVGSAPWVDGGWRYERVEGASHWMQLDRPDHVNRLLLDFLRARLVGRRPGLGPVARAPRTVPVGVSRKVETLVVVASDERWLRFCARRRDEDDPSIHGRDRPDVAMLGCSEYTTRRDKTKKGAGIGAAAGAAGAVIKGEREADEILAGAAVGAAAGAGVGAYMDRQEERLARIPGTSVERIGDGLLLVKFDSDVLFDVDSALVKPAERATVDDVGEVLIDYPKTAVVVQGHTDSTGSEEHNQELSERRADAIANRLIGDGVDQDRIAAIGYGEGYPVADNDSTRGRQQNRRVEILLKARAT